jgi:hypothetical protein
VRLKATLENSIFKLTYISIPYGAIKSRRHRLLKMA